MKDEYRWKPMKDISVRKQHIEWIGVDWAQDSGYNRGDIISRKGNVIKIRFKTVDFNN